MKKLKRQAALGASSRGGGAGGGGGARLKLPPRRTRISPLRCDANGGGGGTVPLRPAPLLTPWLRHRAQAALASSTGDRATVKRPVGEQAARAWLARAGLLDLALALPALRGTATTSSRVLSSSSQPMSVSYTAAAVAAAAAAAALLAVASTSPPLAFALAWALGSAACFSRACCRRLRQMAAVSPVIGLAAAAGDAPPLPPLQSRAGDAVVVGEAGNGAPCLSSTLKRRYHGSRKSNYVNELMIRP